MTDPASTEPTSTEPGQTAATATLPLFREDAYQARCTATVLAAGPDGILLDRTIFYPLGGGQPGDIGVLRFEGGETAIADTVKGEGPGSIRHLPVAGAALPPVGATVEAEIDWPRRHRLMRMHTALHLLCALVAGEVTGGQIGESRSRLDFNLPEAPDKDALTARLNAIVAADHPVTAGWITAADLAARPELVRTMSVKPPMVGGDVRVIRIGPDAEPVDFQPCGGTHVRRTGEIGRLDIGKIEKKGKLNRRINLLLSEP